MRSAAAGRDLLLVAGCRAIHNGGSFGLRTVLLIVNRELPIQIEIRYRIMGKSHRGPRVSGQTTAI